MFLSVWIFFLSFKSVALCPGHQVLKPVFMICSGSESVLRLVRERKEELLVWPGPMTRVWPSVASTGCPHVFGEVSPFWLVGTQVSSSLM